ncbi:hypothetical protein C0J52_09750 [Blattella germanica]|nr:hypothetical protein C0J52_09750 [Blattella germanica]
MPENPNNKQICDKEIFNEEFMDFMRTTKNITSKDFSMAYTWNIEKKNRNASENSVHVNDIMSDLLQKQLISDNASALLKTEVDIPYNPSLTMDLRHEMVKNRHQQKQYQNSEDVVAVAKSDSRCCQGCVKMASARGTSRVLRDEELLDYYAALQSDLSDLSDFEDDCDGDAVYNTSAVISDHDSDENDPPAQAASQTKRQRTGIQCHSGKFVPKIHRFNEEFQEFWST